MEKNTLYMAKVTRIYRSFSFERSFFSVRKHKTEKCPALKRYEQRFVRGLKNNKRRNVRAENCPRIWAVIIAVSG